MKKIIISMCSLAIALSPIAGLAKSDNANAASNGGNAANENTAGRVKLQDKTNVNTQNKGQEKQLNVQENKQNQLEERFSKGKEKGLQMIENRVQHLTQALTRLTERKRIREQERAMINQEIQNSLSAIQGIKGKIESATDLEGLRAQMKNAFNSTKINAVVVPKVRAMAMTSALYNGIDRVEKVFPKVEEAIKNNPDQATETNKLLTESKSLLASAESKTNQAWSAFVKMSPSQDVNAAKTNFQTGKAYLVEARDLLKQSVEKLKQIRTLLQPVEAEDQDADEQGLGETDRERIRTKTANPVEDTTETTTPTVVQ